MKAGTALGLLAGLGAMNAMSGKAYGGKRFTGLMDMLDGGGAGQSGDKFEGGGLLSMLGNLFMKPMQAQENVERIADKVRAEKLGMTTGTPITEYSDSLLAPPIVPKVLDQAPVGTGNPLVDQIIEDRKEQVVMDQPVLPADFFRLHLRMPFQVVQFSLCLQVLNNQTLAQVVCYQRLICQCVKDCLCRVMLKVSWLLSYLLQNATLNLFHLTVAWKLCQRFCVVLKVKQCTVTIC